MQTLTRSLACAAILAVLIFLMHRAIQLGRAGEQFHDHARIIWELRKQPSLSGRHPDAATVAALEADATASLARVPNFGAQWLNQVLIARTLREAPGGAVVENLPLAFDAARAALVRMPHSPVAWAEYSLILDVLHSQGQLRGGVAEVQAAMRRALALGPREPNMLLVMLDLGFRNWDELTPDTRSALSRAVETLDQRRRTTAFQLALRRGREAALCDMASMRAHKACTPVPPPTPAELGAR